MKTSSLVLVVATLLSSSFIEASEKNDPSNKRRKVQRQNRLVGQPTIFNHVLLQYKVPDHALLQDEAPNHSTSSATLPIDQVEDDCESLKSVGELDAILDPKSDDRRPANQRKRKTDDNKVQSAVDALLSLSRSSASHVDIDEEIRKEESEIQVTRRRPVASEPKPLIHLSDGAFFNGRITNFRAYFDERNMQTAGNETLFKCFFFSRFFKLAKFLIENGARLPENEILPAAFAAALSGERNSQVAVDILMELLKNDAVDTVKLFIKVAGMMEKESVSSMDTLLISLLMDPEARTSFLFLPSSSIAQIIKDISDSEMILPDSLAFICNNFDCGEIEKEFALEVAVKAIKNKNSGLLEIFLEKGWIKVDDTIAIEEGKPQLTIISHLFGKFEPQTILRLIKKFNYPLNYTHNHEINPEGDILLAAVMGKDLECFKRLLLAGASLNVKIDETRTLEAIVISSSKKYPEFLKFHEAIENFKSGTLAAQIEAEDTLSNAFNAAEVTTTIDSFVDSSIVDLATDQDSF